MLGMEILPRLSMVYRSFFNMRPLKNKMTKFLVSGTGRLWLPIQCKPDLDIVYNLGHVGNDDENKLALTMGPSESLIECLLT